MIIGLDVGGTHTDVVLLGSKGLLRKIKVPTDATDLFTTVLTSLDQITAGLDVEEIERVVLSTTLTTNAIVQQKIPPVGIIVSSGPGIDPLAYRTNPHFFPVSGSIDHRGREILPIDPAQIQAAANRMKSEGIRHIGVIGKFSVRNPSHELAIRDLLAADFDRIFLGHAISGNLNFPRRITTTFLNAAVYPIHKQFFEAVQDSLAQKGLRIPIHILKADGGTMQLTSSLDYPGQTILSGPAASIMGAMAFAPPAEDAVVLDIGGTTTDMAVLLDQVPLLDPWGIEIGELKTLIRSLNTHSIGLGGDSTVRLEEGRLTIGPDRAGPAMAFGGPFPTPTDALFVLGEMEDGDRERACSGIEPIARGLGLPLPEAARRIFETACQTILQAAASMVERINAKPVYTIHEHHDGRRVRPRKILVLGGPAPHFAKYLARLSDYEATSIPRWEVANAIGAALARTTCEVSVFADTQRGIATSPEENFEKQVTRNFAKEDAIREATGLLKQKAVRLGALPEDLVAEVVEEQQFNMVRGFYTTGRNIRVKVQVKPGLIHGYASALSSLARAQKCQAE